MNATTGKPVIIARRDVNPKNGKAIGEQKALVAAKQALRKYGFVPRKGSPKIELIDHGAFRAYEVTWQAYAADAVAPDMQMVELDAATGVEMTVVDTSRPYDPSQKPEIDEATATSLAIAATGFASPQVLDAQLRVAFDDAGNQRLISGVTFAQPSGDIVEYAVVDVDALTGDAAVVGRG